MSLLTPPQQFGKYSLIEKIGQGGMAEIFKAKAYGSQGFEKVLVVKRILPNLMKDTHFVDMFVNEAKLTVSLSHNNIIQIYELDEADGQFYIAMEFIHGQDMFNVVDRGYRRRVPLPEDLAIHCVIETLKGLEYAHRAKGPDGSPLSLVHRDISPTNIFMSYEGDVKLADFGIAKARMSRQETKANSIKGTLGYMSPEQVMGKELDRRSDLFATGIILYELVTGAKPFSGKGDLDILLKIRDAQFPAPSKVKPDISPQLERIIMRAMTRNADGRYQEAGEFYDDLADYLFTAGMRTSQRKLATYMKNLFADELAEEEAKMRAASGMLQQVGAKRVDGPSPITREDAVSQAGVSAPPAPPPPNAMFYLRRGKGTTEGPLRATEVLQLVRDKRIALDEEVSLDGERWRAIQNFPFPPRILRSLKELAGERGVPVPEVSNPSARVPVRAPAEDVAKASPIVIEQPTPTNVTNDPPPRRDAAVSGGGAGAAAPTPARGLIIPLKVSTPKPRYAGVFSEVTPVRLFYRFAAARETGRLQVSRAHIVKQVYLRDGLPEYVDSNVQSERLGDFLMKNAAISKDQLDEALRVLDQHGGRIGDALRHLKAIPAHELYRLLGIQVKTKLLDVFGWKDGFYAFFQGETTSSEVIPLGIGSFAILAEGVRESLDRYALAPYFKDRMTLPLVPLPNTALDVDSLKLLPGESAIWRRIDGRATMNDLVSLAGEDEAQADVIFRTIYLLAETELVGLGG